MAGPIIIGPIPGYMTPSTHGIRIPTTTTLGTILGTTLGIRPGAPQALTATEVLGQTLPTSPALIKAKHCAPPDIVRPEDILLQVAERLTVTAVPAPQLEESKSAREQLLPPSNVRQITTLVA